MAEVNTTEAVAEASDALCDNLVAALELLTQVQVSLKDGYEELELLNHAQVIFGTLAVLGRANGTAKACCGTSGHRIS